MSETTPKSPCISICALDDNDICSGCFRSAREITDWAMVDGRGKNEIIAKARQRMLDSYPVRLN
ncbi:MAG: putative Fe-S protein YdhL (DUF1289 family) [Halieaceae bacterium]